MSESKIVAEFAIQELQVELNKTVYYVYQAADGTVLCMMRV